MNAVSEDGGDCFWVVAVAIEVIALGIDAMDVVWTGVLDDDATDIESKDEAEDVTAAGTDTERVLAPASHSLASSFSARCATSANFAEIASTAVKLLPRIEAASAILEKQILFSQIDIL